MKKAVAPVILPLSLLAAMCVSVTYAQRERVVAIKAARLIDGTGKPMVQNGVVIFRGDKIESVGSQADVRIPAGAEVIDLGDQTILPGLVNSHAHFSIRNDNRGIRGIIEDGIRHDGQQMTWGVRHVRNELLSGVTTVRTTGDANWIDVYLFEAIRKGTVAGPRIITSGLGLSPTGGHAYPNWMVDGPWEIRKHVRRNLEHGATQMKYSMNDTTPQDTYYTPEEIAAGVNELHRHGRWATSHAVGPYGSSIKRALEGGMNSIEHVTPTNDEIIQLFLKHKAGMSFTWLVYGGLLNRPQDDPESYHYFVDNKANNIKELIDWARERVQRYRREHPELEKTRTIETDPFEVQLFWVGGGQFIGENLGSLGIPRRLEGITDKLKFMYQAYKAGVPVGIGLDGPYGCMPLYVEMLLEGGFSPLEAISVATKGSATVCGWGDKIGTLEPGKYADIIAVRGNPLQDIKALADVKTLIVVGGKIYRDLSWR